MELEIKNYVYKILFLLISRSTYILKFYILLNLFIYFQNHNANVSYMYLSL